MMQEKNVVVIGGGPGTDIALTGLKRYTSRLTALISTPHIAPHGQSQFSENEQGAHLYHPTDEVRSSLLALGADSATTLIMARLFAHRLARSADLGASTFGNLFLSVLAEITGSIELALQAAARVLNVQGQVLPLTLHNSPLVAVLNDGTEVVVNSPAELQAAAAEAGLSYLRRDGPGPLLDAARQAIENADIIVLGPADFHFNLVAPLLLDGLGEALAESSAVKIFVCNTMTQPHITTGWAASRFIHEMLGYLGERVSLDCVIVNSTPFPSDLLARKAEKGIFPVEFDLDACLSMGLNVIVRPVATPQSLLHDPEKLARTILFLGGGRSARRADRRRAFPNGHLNEVLAS